MANRHKSFTRDCSGGISIYAALFTIVAVGAGGLALDFGRMTLLRSEMQNRADAAAMATAQFLDGSLGARSLATDVANNSMQAKSGTSSNDLTISSVTFYTTLSPLLEATSDQNAKFVSVELNQATTDLLFGPVISLLTSEVTSTSTSQRAKAIAGPTPFLCHAPPLMICDFLENTPAIDLRDEANIGRMVVLKEPQGGGSWAPGNFGLLSLPDGSSGANDIEAALAAVEPQDCYDITIDTATGSKTNKIVNGINSRFDRPGNSWPYPAPNVINYPKDDDVIADPDLKLGDGTWDITQYWTDQHGTSILPTELRTHDGKQATRYQVYLFENGLPFWRKGNVTIYPVPGGSMPSGYMSVTNTTVDIPRDLSDPHNNDVDGIPSETVASNGVNRRLIQVAQLKCIAENIHGHGTYPNDGNYLEMLVTEFVPDPPNAAIYGEIVRALTPSNSAEYHANVKLY
ncbi:hypothetical protein A9Q83_16915 [Alphaproteobacteria bacterium 46_93_T64]|nr:hypothetical protein A9Q83_16915 [Alphaproteobacteria bacterium 46_93_T64]